MNKTANTLYFPCSLSMLSVHARKAMLYEILSRKSLFLLFKV